MGLGLAIVKEYATLLEGTFFKVVFPKSLSVLPDTIKSLDFINFYFNKTANEIPKENIPKAEVLSTATANKSRFLITEDNLDIVNYLTALLADDFIIQTAPNTLG